MLTAGRQKPSKGDDMQRGEEVVIVVLGPAIDAWKRAGKQWKTWGPRAVSVCLRVKGMKQSCMWCRVMLLKGSK